MTQVGERSRGEVQASVAGADRLFICVLWALAALAMALAFMQDTFMLALLAGVPLAAGPTVLILAAPAWPGTRMIVGVALMLFSALHIHQTHGMTEAHFGIFVLLAFLVCYQDWRVIVAAAATAAVHHLSFSYLQQWGFPTMCFTRPGLDVVLVHAGYVVAEAGVLSYLAWRLARDSRACAAGTAMLEAMLHTMRMSADGVVRDMQVITETSDGVASSSADLAHRSSAQAERLGQASRSLERLTGAVTTNVEHVAQANRLAASTAHLAGRGGAVVGEVVQTMDAIQDSSRRIGEIMGVIDAIAFQTNILALNAAVEAARAGEAGRGFAVVAAEVRNLSQRSAQAARDVRHLIGQSVARVEDGARLVHQAGTTMNEIVASVSQVEQIMAAIADECAHQRDGIAQMRDTIIEIEQTTRQTVQLVETSRAAVGTMNTRAQSAARDVAALRHAQDGETAWGRLAAPAFMPQAA